MSAERVWLTDDKEPFFEIYILGNRHELLCRASVHCSPAWSAVVTAQLARLVTSNITVLPDVFLQDHNGHVLYGLEAERYWRSDQRQRPLYTTRFTSRQ